jgi:hypothetical protein
MSELLYFVKEAESPLGFEEGLRRTHTRRQPRLDPEFLLLLTANDI